MKNLKNTLKLFALLSIGTVSSLNAQCLHTPKCPFDSCYYGGDGLSKSTAFQLWTVEHLKELGDTIDAYYLPHGSMWHSDKHFRLMQDINDTLRQPIGNAFFRGHFHGGGHSIVVALHYPGPNLKVSQSVIGTQITHHTSVIGIDSLIVNGYYINGSGISSSVDGTYTYIGGCNSFFCDAVVSNCVSNLTITITNVGSVGGIAIRNDGLITNCVNNGRLTGNISLIGGIVANNYGYVTNCLNTGKITSMNHFAGGIAGKTLEQNKGIYNSVNTGSVEGRFAVGGIIADIDAPNTILPLSTITNNINYGFVKGTNAAVGGIVGRISSAVVIITNNSNFGVVVGDEDTGCIVGKNNGGNIISNNHYDKQMCGE